MLKKNRAWSRFGRLGIRRRIALACREGPLPLLQGPQPLAASMKILWGSVLAALPSGRRFKAVTSEELLRPNYSREGGITLGRVVPGKGSPREGFGRVTLGKVVQGNYSPESDSVLSGKWPEAKSLFGKWLGRNTLGKVVRGNFSVRHPLGFQ